MSDCVQMMSMLRLSGPCSERAGAPPWPGVGNLPQPVQLAVEDWRAHRVAADRSPASLEEVTWPTPRNPSPGYHAQVLTPGYRVAEPPVSAMSTSTAAPSSLSSAPGRGPGRESACAAGAKTKPGAPGDDPRRQDRSRRPAAHPCIQCLSGECGERDLARCLLGFPRPDARHDPQPTPGYRLIFETAEGVCPYHTDLAGRVVAGDDVATTSPPDQEGGPVEEAVTTWLLGYYRP